MPMLTATDVSDLLAIATDAQPAHSLVLYRTDGAGGYAARPAQAVQVTYTSQRMARSGGIVGVDETLDDVTFYKAPPFDVQVDDYFEIDGHRGGVITGIQTDPVLGLIGATGRYDVGRIS